MAQPHEEGSDELISRLLSTLSTEHERWIEFYHEGQIRRISYPEFHHEIMNAADVMDAIFPVDQNANTNEGVLSCIVSGAPSYGWLVASFAAFYRGYTVIALPENLSPEEAEATLDGLSYDFALTDDEQSATLQRFTYTLSFSELLNQTQRPRREMPLLKPRYSLVAFTSGTTSGKKLKAFEVIADSTEYFAQSFSQAFGLIPGDRWVICSPFSHIVHFEYVISSILLRINILIVEPIDLILNSRHLAPSVLITVPAVYELLASTLEARVRETAAGRLRLKLAHLVPDYLYGNRIVRQLFRLLQSKAYGLLGGNAKVMIIGAAPSTRLLKKRLIALGLPLFEGYGMSEVGMISCNTPRRTKFGSIGLPFSGVEIGFSEEGTLRVRTDYLRTSKYLNVSNFENDSVFMAEGWIETGDIIVADRSGYLSIIGRHKNLLITDRGKKINPAPIEAQFESSGLVKHAIIIGNNKPFLSVLLCPYHDCSKSELATLVARVNKTLTPEKEVKAMIVASSPPTVDNGQLTRSGKLRREAFIKRHASEVEKVYCKT